MIYFLFLIKKHRLLNHNQYHICILQVELRKSTSPIIKIGNERSDLLKQIEAGKKLRPIELKKRQSQVKLEKYS